MIGTTGGATPETVPPGAGVLVPPDDVTALAAALRRIIAEPATRHAMADAARASAAALPGWCDSAKILAAAIERAA